MSKPNRQKLEIRNLPAETETLSEEVSDRVRGGAADLSAKTLEKEAEDLKDAMR